TPLRIETFIFLIQAFISISVLLRHASERCQDNSVALHGNHFAKLATNFTNYTKQPWSAITTTNQHYRKTFVKFVAGFFLT
ncbi:MAG: hypothetical protein DMG09_27550, partial [Acidobacteria bacterium]